MKQKTITLESGVKCFVPEWWGEKEIANFKNRSFSVDKLKTIRVQGDEIPFTEMREMKEVLNTEFRSRSELKKYKELKGLTQDSTKFCHFGKSDYEKKKEQDKMYREAWNEAKQGKAIHIPD